MLSNVSKIIYSSKPTKNTLTSTRLTLFHFEDFLCEEPVVVHGDHDDVHFLVLGVGYDDQFQVDALVDNLVVAQVEVVVDDDPPGHVDFVGLELVAKIIKRKNCRLRNFFYLLHYLPVAVVE